MHVNDFVTKVQANERAVRGILLVTDFNSVTITEQGTLTHTLLEKGFMGLDAVNDDADAFAVLQATFRKVRSDTARRVAAIIGIEVIEASVAETIAALNTLKNCEQVIDGKLFSQIEKLVSDILDPNLDSIRAFPNGPTASDCDKADKIRLEVHLPDGAVGLSICTACAKHFILTGEGEEMWMHPVKVRALLAAIISIMGQSNTGEHRVPREKLN